MQEDHRLAFAALIKTQGTIGLNARHLLDLAHACSIPAATALTILSW